MLEANRISKVVVIVFSVLVSQSLYGQGVQLHTDQAMDGYTLYESGNTAVLIDNCGHLLHEWNDVAAQYHPKLMPNGNIIYIESFSRDIVEKDWNDNTINKLSINSSNIFLDYEVIIMPNGNYLCLARKSFSQSQFESLGYNYGSTQGDGIGNPSQVDMVVEVDRNTGNIVWQWNVADHVIQERDPSKGNFGVVADHPELLNMDAIATYDWTFQESFMINGFDYNAELDQIVLSIRKMSEIVIIDHSTTTAEAAGHSGGNSGKGGDILYRWGNPQNYGQGDGTERELYFQHNPNWIKYGSLKGNIIMYNNGLNRPGTNYSAVPIINTEVDVNGDYTIQGNGIYSPEEPSLEYSPGPSGLGYYGFYSGYTSAAKILTNGNVLVTVGGDDEIFEMTPDGSVVWIYGLYQSDLTFRVEKYASDYPAFDGRDLTAGDVLEFPPSTISCTLVDVEDAYFDNSHAWIADSQVNLTTDISGYLTFKMYSLDGQLLIDTKFLGDYSIDISDFSEGIYFINIKTEQSNKSITFKVSK